MAIEIEVRPEHVSPDGRVSRETLCAWFEQARAAYFELCSVLAEGKALPVVTATEMTPSQPVGSPNTVVVAVSATELRDTSFEMRSRIRNLSSGGEIVASGRCSLALTDPATGERVALSPELRRELIALETSARHYA